MTNRDRLLEVMARGFAEAMPGRDWDSMSETGRGWWRKHTENALRALEQNGFKVMERRLTLEMDMAAMRSAERQIEDREYVLHADVYKAMFDASPAYTEGGEPDRAKLAEEGE